MPPEQIGTGPAAPEQRATRHPIMPDESVCRPGARAGPAHRRLPIGRRATPFPPTDGMSLVLEQFRSIHSCGGMEKAHPPPGCIHRPTRSETDT